MLCHCNRRVVCPICCSHVRAPCRDSALRPLQAGEQLTLDYLGGKMQTLNVVARREKLAVRGFVCGCSRCLREGGAGDAAAPLPSDEEMLHKPLTEEEVEMLMRSLPASASGEMRTA